MDHSPLRKKYSKSADLLNICIAVKWITRNNFPLATQKDPNFPQLFLYVNYCQRKIQTPHFDLDVKYNYSHYFPLWNIKATVLVHTIWWSETGFMKETGGFWLRPENTRDSSEELVILGLKFGAFPAPPPSQHADVLQSEYIDFPFRSKQQPNLDRCVEWLAKQPRPRFQNLYRQNKVGKVQFQEFFFPFPPPAAPRALGMCLDPPLLSSQPKTSRTNPGRRPAVSLIATSPSLAFYNTGSSFLSSSKL